MSYAVWTSDNSAYFSRSGNNLILEKSAGDDAWRSAFTNSLISSGKVYWEVYISDLGAGDAFRVGICSSAMPISTTLGSSPDSYGYSASNGSLYNDSVPTDYGDVFTAGDTIGVALDMGAGKVWFSKNGVWQNGGDPESGTGEAFSGITGDIIAAVALWFAGAIITLRSDEADTVYSAPVGFIDGLAALESTIAIDTGFELQAVATTFIKSDLQVQNTFALNSIASVGVLSLADLSCDFSLGAVCEVVDHITPLQVSINAGFALSTDLAVIHQECNLRCSFVLGGGFSLLSSEIISSVLNQFVLSGNVAAFSSLQDFATGASFIFSSPMTLETDSPVCRIPGYNSSRWA